MASWKHGLLFGHINLMRKEVDEMVKEILEEKIVIELESIDEDQLYDDMLDECYPETEVAGMTFQTSYALKELDPTAYRCGMNDYMDSLEVEEINGSYYWISEVDEIREDLEAEETE